MRAGDLGWVALAIVVVFWGVGAYNRLMRLRNDIGAAWQQAEPIVERRGEAMVALVDVLRGPLADEQNALDAALEAGRALAMAGAGLRQRPFSPRAADALAATLPDWTSRTSRVLALLAQRPEVQGAEGVAEPLRLLTDADARWPFARQAFNEAVAIYNAAVGQWPTAALARVFAFAPARAI